MKKLIALLTAAVLSLVLLTGCSGNIKSIHKLNVDGKEVSLPYVTQIGSYKIGLDEYRYYYMNIKSQLGMSNETLTQNEEAQTQLKSYVEDSIKNNYAMIATADELKVTLTDEEKKEVDDNIQAQRNTYESEEKYQEYLNQIFITEDIQREYAYLNQRIVKMKNDMFAEGGKYEANGENMKNLFNEDYIRVKHVLVASTTKDNEKVAKEVADKAKKGEDFDKLIETYGEDPGMQTNPLGYIFTQNGQMVKEFEDAAFALDVDAISDPVQSDHGYHIIKRYPLDEGFINENIEGISDIYKQETLSKVLIEKSDNMQFKHHRDYDKVTPLTLQ